MVAGRRWPAPAGRPRPSPAGRAGAASRPQSRPVGPAEKTTTCETGGPTGRDRAPAGPDERSEGPDGRVGTRRSPRRTFRSRASLVSSPDRAPGGCHSLASSVVIEWTLWSMSESLDRRIEEPAGGCRECGWVPAEDPEFTRRSSGAAPPECGRDHRGRNRPWTRSDRWLGDGQEFLYPRTAGRRLRRMSDRDRPAGRAPSRRRADAGRSRTTGPTAVRPPRGGGSPTAVRNGSLATSRLALYTGTAERSPRARP
jgi:hypothetical protein